MSTINTTNLKNPSSGSNNVVLNADGTSTLTPSNIIKSGTAVASTSGTAIDFTGIPAWVKRITVMFNGVSTSGASFVQVQLGTSAGIQTTGYESYHSYLSSTPSYGLASASTGFVLYAGSATSVRNGIMTIATLGMNEWVSSHSIGCSDGPLVVTLNGGGRKSLLSAPTTVRITTVNGTDTFDYGFVNILMEG